MKLFDINILNNYDGIDMIKYFFFQYSTKAKVVAPSVVSDCIVPNEKPATITSSSSTLDDSDNPIRPQNDISKSLKRKYDTPAQNVLQSKILVLHSRITASTEMRDSGFGTEATNIEIKEARKELKENEKALKIMVTNAKHQQNFRSKRRSQQTCKKQDCNSPLNSSELVSSSVGRPSLEVDQPNLLKAICDIAIQNSAAHERRQTEEIRTCQTLRSLTEELNKRGFTVSKSAVYLRILPRNSATIEGSRHKNPAPVKLCKAQNDFHKSHPDAWFCTSTIRNVDALAALLGPKQVAYLSQDDKARVKIGVTAANKQAPRVMHVEYRVKLPDHDFVVASKHSLIPSVYAGIVINSSEVGSTDGVSYSGPTYVAIRSGKHSSLTAETHHNDFNRLLELETIDDVMKVDGKIKPVVIISVDGGPDENPR